MWFPSRTLRHFFAAFAVSLFTANIAKRIREEREKSHSGPPKNNLRDPDDQGALFAAACAGTDICTWSGVVQISFMSVPNCSGFIVTLICGPLTSTSR